MMLGSFTRSDLAARYYDAILFDGATFADLVGKPGPLVMASSTEFASGYPDKLVLYEDGEDWSYHKHHHGGHRRAGVSL